MKRVLPALGLLGVLGVLSACAPAHSSSSNADASQTDAPPQRDGPVLMYGDSLLEEASLYVNSADEIRAFGGTALCDWVDNMAAAAAIVQPTMMVVEFVGNNVTPCMEGYDSPDQVRAKYEADATDLKQRVDTPILWVGPPEFRTGPAPTAGMFDAEPRFVDAGAAVLDDGDYTDALPCLPEEGPSRGCDDGRIRVRSPDGAHFCPSGATPCDDYSAGARRFADAIDEAVFDVG